MSTWENQEFNKSEFRYVSEGLNECYKAWTSVTPILIDAPTGSGKNTFILDTIIPSLGSIQKLLILSNRTALNLQFKRKLRERLGAPPISDHDLAKQELFGNVWVISYQKIFQYLNTPNHPLHNIYSEVSHIVMDEAHFFLSDACFNPETEAILYTLLSKYPWAIRIYMSATPAHVKDLLSTIEASYFSNRVGSVDHSLSHQAATRHMLNSTNSRGLQIYKFHADYSDCKFHLFSEWDILAKQILVSPTDEKWLIFVKSISEGNELKEKLSKSKIPAKQIMTIDASKKDSEEYGAIVRRERFEVKVLISTSVIDNGVNIKDSMLKHVVIHSLDPVSAIQMAGRKRRDDGETVNFYFKTPTKQEVQQAINTTVQLKTFAESILNDGSGNHLRNHWGQISEAEQKLLLAQSSPSNNGAPPIFTFQVNCFALEKLKIAHGELEALKDILILDPEEGYQKLVLGWFNNPIQPNEIKVLTLTPELVEQQMTGLKAWLDEMVAKGPLTEKKALQAEIDLARFYEDILNEKPSISVNDDKTSKVRSNIKGFLTRLSLSEIYVFERLTVTEATELNLPDKRFYWQFKQNKTSSYSADSSVLAKSTM